MSWFQDLAGKAENILNKLDQNAAEVLREDPQEPTLPAKPIATITNEKKLERIATPSRGLNLSSPRKPVKFVIDPEDMTTFSKPEVKVDLELVEQTSEADEKASDSNVSSSRHSSFSSKVGGGTVIEKIDELRLKPSSSASNSIHQLPVKDTTYQSNYEEMLALKIILNDVKAEREDLKLEVDTLMEQLKEARNDNRIRELEDICSCLSDDKQALTDKFRQVEQSNTKYIKSISELESSLSKHHQNENELKEKYETAKSEAELAVQELGQYRTRAQLTLQAKEKLIEQLKAGIKGESVSDNAEQTLENTLDLEIAQLKAEKKDLQDEISKLEEKYDQSKQYFENLEGDMKKSLKALEEKLADTQANLKKECRLSKQLEDEVRSEKRELETVRSEQQKQRINFTTKLHERDQEVLRLQAKSQQRQAALLNQSGDDLENRMQSLTASLVQKQTNLEMVTAEKNALRMQLEKLDTQYRTLSMEMKQIRPQIIHMENVTDDAKSQVPNFIQENPFDTRIARRFKRAYSSLDSVGIRLGVFMRRYPLARIMVIFYILILHMFILCLLLSSTPT